MKIGNPIQILNPYDWLPGFGESKVCFYSAGLDVIVDISYERAGAGADETLLVRRELRFKNVSHFLKLPFPAIDFFQFAGDASEFALGALTEFRRSDLLSLGGVSFESGRIKHFSIQFLSENLSLHVIAEEVSLSEELSMQ